MAQAEGRPAVALIAFYILSTVVVLSALFVVAARNPVHSVLWLILAFFTSAGLLVLIGAEFLAMLLVVVYVGAVAVLFLFVVMMLDIDFAQLRAGFIRNFPLGIAVALVLLASRVADGLDGAVARARGLLDADPVAAMAHVAGFEIVAMAGAIAAPEALYRKPEAKTARKCRRIGVPSWAASAMPIRPPIEVPTQSTTCASSRASSVTMSAT